MKALDEYFLMLLFMLLLNTVHIFAIFMSNLDRETMAVKELKEILLQGDFIKNEIWIEKPASQNSSCANFRTCQIKSMLPVCFGTKPLFTMYVFSFQVMWWAVIQSFALYLWFMWKYSTSSTEKQVNSKKAVHQKHFCSQMWLLQEGIFRNLTKLCLKKTALIQWRVREI